MTTVDRRGLKMIVRERFEPSCSCTQESARLSADGF